MTILNDWLAQKPEYQVVRAESIERKVDHSGHLETESTIYFQAALGQSTYVRGIRYDIVILSFTWIFHFLTTLSICCE